MSHPKNTKTHNIFFIDKNMLPKMNGQSAPQIKDVLARIMSKDKCYKLQSLKPDIKTNSFSVYLYFRGEDKHQSKFSSFCKDFVKNDQTAVTFYPRSSSSVLFIWNDKHIYAVTTGQGFRMIEEYSLPKFGLIVASIFNERFKITSLDSNAMSSIVHSTKTVYSNEIDFIDVNALDTIFKEVTGRLKDANEIRSLLKLNSSSKKKSMKVTAKNFVQFSSALNFEGLLHLLSIIDGYDFKGYQDRFNMISPLNEKKNADIITKNNKKVIAEIYKALKSGENIPFDLFHKDTIAYISADSYIIYNSTSKVEYNNCDDLTDSCKIFDAYKKYLNGNQDTQNSFNTFIESVSIRANKDDVVGITDESLLKHISGEIQVDGINYFIFYGKYYQLSENYTNRLNNSLRGKLHNKLFTNKLTTEWPEKYDEDWFNKEVSENEDYIHLHKVKPDLIEFADLMKLEDDIVTVVHVKKGFNCDMRTLDRQVELSVEKIMDIKHYNNDSYMRTLYKNASSCTTGKNITTVFPTVDKFLECMKNKSIHYIIVIRPENKELLDNTSNIAKHCLNALILRCFQQNIELEIQVL